MSGEFLKRAQMVKPAEPTEMYRYDHGGGRIAREDPRQLIADCYGPNDNREAVYLALQCWSELLAVVEAASKVNPSITYPREMNLRATLDALDKKAGAL